MLREYNDMKEEIKNPKIHKYIKTMETRCVSCKKNTVKKNYSVRKTKQTRLMLL